jgi:hypothetical protein
MMIGSCLTRSLRPGPCEPGAHFPRRSDRLQQPGLFLACELLKLRISIDRHLVEKLQVRLDLGGSRRIPARQPELPDEFPEHLYAVRGFLQNLACNIRPVRAVHIMPNRSYAGRTGAPRIS